MYGCEKKKKTERERESHFLFKFLSVSSRQPHWTVTPTSPYDIANPFLGGISIPLCFRVFPGSGEGVSVNNQGFKFHLFLFCS